MLMSDLRNVFTRKVLPLVQTPGQYIGGEVNSIRKDHRSVAVTFALAFPDAYSVGMSHLGLQVLYHVLNSRPDVACERVFAPLPDMARELEKQDLPLVTLESFTPVADFDFLGFTLQHEMTYTNLLMMLKLARVPLLSVERTTDHPLVIAGGPGAATPEPLADFVDIFLVGEAEEELPRLMDRFHQLRGIGDRFQLLHRLAVSSRSLYVPAMYQVEYDGPVMTAFRPRFPDVPEKVERAVVQDFENAPVSTAPVVPFTETVHDRIALEVMRGCPHSCRFCQAGITRQPVRFRSVDRLVELAEATWRSTGYDEISLLSLSSNDYPHLDELLRKLEQRLAGHGVNVSVPSLHVSANLSKLPQVLAAVRKSGLTFAPEAATPELRAIIGKRIEEKDLLEGVTEAWRAGWNLVKLYFMVGLPGETDADLDAMADLAERVSRSRRQMGKGSGNVNLSVAWFVPKPHTPLQWEAMAAVDYLHEARRRLSHRLRDTKIRARFHHIGRSRLEAAICRGDRRMGGVIRTAFELGARFDDWDEHFREDLWTEAFARCGVNPLDYSHRPRTEGELLPWGHIVSVPSPDYLVRQRDIARQLVRLRQPGRTGPTQP